MVVCLEQGANDLFMIQLMSLPSCHLLLQQNPQWFILLVPAYPGCPGKKHLNECCCFCVSAVVIVRAKCLVLCCQHQNWQSIVISCILLFNHQITAPLTVKIKYVNDTYVIVAHEKSSDMFVHVQMKITDFICLLFGDGNSNPAGTIVRHKSQIFGDPA